MTKLSPLASVSATREVLQRHGLATKKALGQHFLIDDGVVRRICETAELTADDLVLEVGPGIGTLTVALLQKAGGVVAVERDVDLLAVLAETCQPYEDQFALIQKDALMLNPEDIRASILEKPALKRQFPNKFVANLPYAVAATLILDFFQKFDSLQSATVMIQREVADRICAQPGTKEYGAFTVKLGLYVEPQTSFLVKPQNFFPPPRVDSSVLRLDRRILHDEAGHPINLSVIEHASIMADAAFANRRKTLSNSCKTYFAIRGEGGVRISETLPLIFEKAGIDPKIRGEALDLSSYLRLGEALLSLR